MNASNLASRKLVVALAAIAAIALNSRMGLGLATEDVAGIVSVAMTAIGMQGVNDLVKPFAPLLGAKFPALLSALTATAPAAPQNVGAPIITPTPPAAPPAGGAS